MRNLMFLLIALTLFSQEKERIDWPKIVPLQTTRADVEKMLGKPVKGTGYVWSYDSNDDRITIWYGGVKPAANSPCKWELSKDTVLSFVYAPKRKLPLDELKVDLTKFQRQKAYEMENDFYYYNALEGLTLTTRVVDGKEMFLSIERDPDQAQRQKYCTPAIAP